MATSKYTKNIPLDILHPYRSLYQYHRSFKYFEEISNERFKELREMGMNHANKFKPQYKFVKEYLYYLLNHTRTNSELKTWDEKMVFYIYAFDPNYITAKTYSKNVTISLKEIEETVDNIKRDKLIETRDNAIEETRKEVTEKIGYYDKNLQSFEKLLVRRFFRKTFDSVTDTNQEQIKSNIFASNINNDYTNELLKQIKENGIDALDTFEYEKIKNIAKLYKSTINEFNYNDVIFQLIHQSNLLSLTTLSEKIVFLIELVDPNLVSLKSYFENCHWNHIQESIEEKLNYFSKDLVYIEKIFDEVYELNTEKKLNL